MISSPHGRLAAPNRGDDVRRLNRHLQQTQIKRFLSDSNQNYLLASSSDGISGSSTAGSISDTIRLHPNQQLTSGGSTSSGVSDGQSGSQRFVSSDGFIFSLGSSEAKNHNDSHNNQQQRDTMALIGGRAADHLNADYHAIKPTARAANDLSSSPNSTSTRVNLEHHHQPLDQRGLLPMSSGVSCNSNSRESLTQQQQQHRRLQYQVHQQLQRIYGNRNVALPDDRKLEHQQQHQHQVPQQKAPQIFVQNQPTERQKFLMKRHQIQQTKRLNEAQAQTYNLTHEDHRIAQQYATTTNQIHQQLNNHPEMLHNHLIHQHPTQHHHQHYQDQTYDSLNSSNHHNHVLKNKTGDIYDLNNDHVPSPARRQLNTSTGPIAERVNDNHEDEEEQEDLLLPEALVDARPPVTARRPAIDRKSQLESLHYATVTAAALLSATANAAAAFVETEKQFDTRPQVVAPPASEALTALHSRRAVVEQPPVASRPKRVASGAIYSDAYQHIQRNPRSQSEPYENPDVLVPGLGIPKQQNIYKTPIYSNASEPQQQQVAATVAADKFANLHTSSQIYQQLARLHNHNQQQHHQQSVQKYHQIPPRNFNSQQPLPQAINRMLTNRQQPLVNINHLLRLQQQNQLNQLIQQRAIQQRLVNVQPPAASQQVPALAILHQPGNKNGPELLGKIMISNPLAVANRPRSSAVDLARLVQAKAILNAKKMNQLIVNGSGHNNNQQVNRNFAPTASMGSVAALSDSSVASHAPFDLDKTEHRPIGCMDRICRINLTMFWWGLLLVSCAFVSAAISIYRYIF